MRRREFIAVIGGALWPLAARAQQAKVPVIGWLGSTAPQPSHVIPFVEGLRAEGLTENKDVVVHYRWAQGAYERLAAFVEEFVGDNVDLIRAHNRGSTRNQGHILVNSSRFSDWR